MNTRRDHLAIAALACVLAAAAYARPDGDDPDSEADAAPMTAVRILSLGDSYTIGEGVPEAERWPVQLARALDAAGVRTAPPQIIARTGWTTLDLAGAVARAPLAPPYDLVTLLIGVNDQYQGFALESYPERFRALLATAIELAGGDRDRVIVVSIPDYSVTPFGRARGAERIHAELARVNEINLAVAREAGVALVDITPLSRDAARDASLLAPDGLHPSGRMYAQWSERVLRLAAPRLRGDTRPPS